VVEHTVLEVALPSDINLAGSFRLLHFSPVHLSVQTHLPSLHFPPFKHSLSPPHLFGFGDAAVGFPLEGDGT
jgi:hypothetical protein